MRRHGRIELAELRTQVAIVGGGPVGLGLAVELGQRGIEVVVIERSNELHHIPKGQNLTQRTMEHFRAWGVEERMRAARVMPPGYPAVGVNAYGTLLSEYAHPWYRRSDVNPFYFARNERLPQYITEGILRDRVAELDNIAALYGTPADEIHQDGDAAYVTTELGLITADYLVGCDGSRSMVRQHAPINETLSDHDRRMVLLVFRSAELQEIVAERFGQAAFFSILDPDLDGYWRFLGTVDAKEQWFFHAPVDPASTRDTLDYAALLHETVGARFATELDYMGFWDLRIAFADSYRRDRIFIAGDAAHSHPPYGGYGINTGFEDARNLGWKLAAMLDGWGNERLLDSYTEERRPVFASTARDFIEAFIANDREFTEAHDPRVDEAAFAAAWEHRKTGSGRAVTVFAPHYAGSQIVFGPEGGESSAIGEHTFVAQPGHHLAPHQLSSGEDLFPALGHTFALVAADDAAASLAGFQKAARDARVPLVVITDNRAALEAHYGASFLLIRPDHFVSWTARDDDFDPIRVLHRSIARS